MVKEEEKPSFEELLEALKDEDDQVRRDVLLILEELTNQLKTIKHLEKHEFEALFQLLKVEGQIVRKYAVRALGQLDDLRVVDLLVQLLRDENYEVRNEVLKAFEKLGKPAIIPLVRLLKDKDWIQRLSAARLLGQLGDSRAVEPLIQTLKDKESDVRSAATIALGRLGDSRAVEPLIQLLNDEDEQVRMEALLALVLKHLGKQEFDACVIRQFKDPRAVESLIEMLNDENPTIRAYAVRALGQFKDPRVVESLIEMLNDEDWMIRIVSARALGQLNDPQVVELLVQLLKDENQEVRKEITKVLGKLGKPAVNPLIQLLKDKDWSVRQSVVDLLEQLRDSRALEPLIQSLKDKHWAVRKEAAFVLGKLGDSKAVVPLLELLEDEVDDVKETAVRSLGQLKDKRAIEPLIEFLLEIFPIEEDPYDKIFDTIDKAFIEIGEDAVIALINKLENEEKKYAVLWTLDSIVTSMGEEILELLVSEFENGNTDIKQSLIQVIYSIKDNKTINFLLDTLKDSEKIIREEIIKVLAYLKTSFDVDRLVNLLEEEAKSKKNQNRDDIQNINLILEPLYEQLNEGSPIVKKFALKVFSKLKSEEILESLVQLIIHRFDLDRIEIKLIFEILGEKGEDLIIKELENPDWKIRRRVVVLLAKIEGKRILEGLKRALEIEKKKKVKKVMQSVIKHLDSLREKEKTITVSARSKICKKGVTSKNRVVKLIESLISGLIEPDKFRKKINKESKMSAKILFRERLPIFNSDLRLKLTDTFTRYFFRDSSIRKNELWKYVEYDAFWSFLGRFHDHIYTRNMTSIEVDKLLEENIISKENDVAYGNLEQWIMDQKEQSENSEISPSYRSKDKEVVEPVIESITVHKDENDKTSTRVSAGQRKIFKITLLGDGSVGKTSLRKSYLGEGFKDGYSMTIGADFLVKHLQIDERNFVAQIWDLAGQQRFSAVRETYFRGTSGCLLVFDITRRSSYENIPSWIAELLKNNSNRIVPMVLIGNKSDILSTAKDPLSPEQAEQYARALSQWSGITIPYIETSAKTGENVDEAFKELIKNILRYDGGKGGLAPSPIVPGDDPGGQAGMPRKLKDWK